MTEVFLLLKLISQILELAPNRVESIKIRLSILKERYTEEVSKPKDKRDDALIDELREEIYDVSEYVSQLISTKQITFNSNPGHYSSSDREL